MNEQEEKVLYEQLLVAYAYFIPITEAHIDRFTWYESDGLDMREGIAVEIRVLAKVLEIVHRLTDLEVYSDALIDLLSEVSFESWQALLKEYPNCFTESEATSFILKNQFQQHDWDAVFCTKDPLYTITNKMMSIFTLWEVMGWENVVEVANGVASRLTVYPSFQEAILVFLNVYADNTGFDADEDRKSLCVLRTFLDDIRT